MPAKTRHNARQNGNQKTGDRRQKRGQPSVPPSLCLPLAPSAYHRPYRGETLASACYSAKQFFAAKHESGWHGHLSVPPSLRPSVPPSSPRGFTLIELMVVIGILGLLAAIVIPAANSLLTSNRTKATLTTMKVIENAMEEFRWQGAGLRPKDSLKDDDPTFDKDDKGNEWTYKGLFGNLPPSPNSKFAINPEPQDQNDCSSQVEQDDPKVQQAHPEVGQKLARLLSLYYNVPTNVPINDIPIQIECAPDSPNPVDFAGRFASIECLHLTLNQCCPTAKSILDNLPGQSVTNLDSDWVQIEVEGRPPRRIDLLEIVDAWGRPLRYSVKRPVYDDSGRIVIPARWELRSAGADGAFGVLGSEDEDSDDVVLRGP